MAENCRDEIFLEGIVRRCAVCIVQYSRKDCFVIAISPNYFRIGYFDIF
jgi:hypothetical protein